VKWRNYIARSQASVSSGRECCTHMLLSHDYLLEHASYCLMSRLLSIRPKKSWRRSFLFVPLVLEPSCS
jgi:hypothetical protein